MADIYGMDFNENVLNFLTNLEPIPAYPKNINPRLHKVGNSSEVMVNIDDMFHVENVYNSFNDVPHREHLFLRAHAVELLLDAEKTLPEGFKFIIFDTHRNTSFQAKLLQHFVNENPELKEGFVSDPKDSALVPPHTTGGTVDLSLKYKGKVLDLGTDYDSFESTAAIDSFEGTELMNSMPSLLRRVLYKAMTNVGFAPYPLEWWHWSYGDQWWAAFYNHPSSIYSSVEI